MSGRKDNEKRCTAAEDEENAKREENKQVLLSKRRPRPHSYSDPSHFQRAASRPFLVFAREAGSHLVRVVLPEVKPGQATL